MPLIMTSIEQERFELAVKRHTRHPSTASDPRANLARCFALAHGAALGLAPSSQRLSFYNADEEYDRQGIKNPLSHWRISEANLNYELCPSYPRVLAVPMRVSDQMLHRAAAFRSGRRLPVLSWKDTASAASICRCSQPMVGVAKSRSSHDEALLQAIVDTNPHREALLIIDCRPRMNAELNHAKGKGYEHPAQYLNTKLTFASIDNIHVMRVSLRALLNLLSAEAVQSGAREKDFLSELERCGWMEHLRKVLIAATQVAHAVHRENFSVLIHCSDGWDRTAQVSALAQLMLDHTFRTRRGFEALVEKEWVEFGHQFALRCGTVAPIERGGVHAAPSDEQLSPIFLQFVDCVWQLSQQWPTAFEFNSHYLASLLYHLTSGLHATFMANCERQRSQLRLCERAACVWRSLDGDQYRNQAFIKSEAVLFPELGRVALQPWLAYYCRGSDCLRPDPLVLAEARCATLVCENEQLHERLRAALAGQRDKPEGQVTLKALRNEPAAG